MSMTFTKLFTSITESTIWNEDDRTRLVWITMLAMADSRGRVWASVPGLANRARVPVDACEAALNRFQEPDKYSRTRENEGRRIEAIDGGWRLLNHGKYRAIRDDEAVKESKRRSAGKRRKGESDVENVELGRTPSNSVERCRTRSNGVEPMQRQKADATQRQKAEAGPPEEPTAPAAPAHELFPELRSQAGFEAALADFVLHRKKLRKPLTERATALLMRRLAEHPAKAVFALETAIEKGWQSIEWSWLETANQSRSVPRTTEAARDAHRAKCYPESLKANVIQLPLP